MDKKVVIAMSGGVDSSVAAKLMIDRGFKAVGIFLHFWKEKGAKEFENKCCSAEAYMDAARVCRKIGIPVYTMNFSQVFKKEIVDDFISEYKRGRTPNPCARCNKSVKLGLLIKRAKKMGFDFVASGHYAIIKKTKFYKLCKAKDEKKDQSYFLYNLKQEQLKYLIFPLGEFTKEETRKMARRFGLAVAEKKDSQEICFIPGKSHNEFLKRHIKLKPGKILTLDGKIIGEHQGLPLYTVGQRKGIEIGGTGPYYAAKFNYKENILYVVDDADHPALFSNSLIAKNINWISGVAPKFPLTCDAVIRYKHRAVKSKIKPYLSAGRSQKSKIVVEFLDPQRAVTPGQSVVFYKGDEVLGGGVIDRAD